MQNQKKISKNNQKTPVSRRTADRKNDNPLPIVIAAGIITALILLGLIVYFNASEGSRMSRQSGDSETDTMPKHGIINSADETASDYTELQYGIEMVYVRGGALILGCTPEQEGDCYDYEKLVYQVTLGDFYIGKHEVTQAQWQAVMQNNPSNFKGNDLPVENVSWEDAQEFIRKLNTATGKMYRLPTDAEWEYAARGGRKNLGYIYSGSDNVEEVAWYEGNSKNRTHSVGTKAANELGIYDMSGNVWEWVSDRYSESDGAEKTYAEDSGEGSFRIIRGGGWGTYARGLRVSNYFNNGSDNRYNILGFRLACD